MLLDLVVSQKHSHYRYRSSDSVHINHQNKEKGDLCDFDHDMVVGTRWPALSI